ncbi:MAG: peptidylprolyl isomerase [Methylococcales symbiont of Hymedesmia sp. n. MRB-2018]|nr:MAG: peptidylprolyl isomerase [Methylococcales symbiont of Hymedesmia sp. n. MRB-2018]
MKKRIIPLIIASSCILSACTAEESATENNTSSTAITVVKEDAIAIVNGKYISKASLAQLEQEINQRSPNHTFPKEKLIEELIQRELLTQEAINKQLDKSAEYTERLQTVKDSLLSQAAIQNFLKSNPVTDAELEAEYNKNISVSGKEYKARHILLKSEEEAKIIIKELVAGADFIALAKAKSSGPSGPEGGDLGWFSAAQMVVPFSEATIALEDGKFSTEPVKTQFGWHIILKEASRDPTPPSFASVKEKIHSTLQHGKMQGFIAGLLKPAKIEILLAKEAEVKAPADTATGDKNRTEATNKTTETVIDTKSSAEEIQQTVTEAESTTKKSVSDTATKTLETVTPLN